MVMGEDDLTAPVENGHLMKRRHGERLELAIIPEAGHVVGLEKHQSTRRHCKLSGSNPSALKLRTPGSAASGSS